MKILLVACFTVISVISIARPVSNTNTCDTDSLFMPAEKFSAMIDSIETQIVDLASAGDVFKSKQFIYIYQNTDMFMNNVIDYLSNAKTTRQKKLIAIMSMNKKNFQSNITFLEKCNLLYKKHLISDDELFWIIYPRESTNREIIKNYQNARVKAVLTDIKSNPRTSKGNRKNIEQILNGNVYIEQKEFFSSQNIEI